jgi:putative pyruvate formate lyase activating enzyme
MQEPSYLKLHQEGEIKKRIAKLKEIIRDCHLCPHNCKVNRLKGKTGVCKSDSRLKVASYGPHFGEEAPLVGTKGSGTIFFSNCSLECVYCQNYDISQKGHGQYMSPKEVADIMLNLQKRGCHNINFVTPTHMVYGIMKAVDKAIEQGLKIPLVYNTGGYDSVKTLKLLDGIIDIYMPDIKYADNKLAQKYSNAPDYFDIVKKAVTEMQKQVNDLEIVDGIAKKGLLVRHLVLPENISGTEKIIDFITNNISENTYFNLMKQYYPSYKADKYTKLNQKINNRKYQLLKSYANQKGLRLDQ